MNLSRFARPAALIGVVALLSGCGGGGLFGRNAPDEFAVSRAAPLVVPPDYALAPPKPGAPRPLAADSQQQAIEALFGPGVRVLPKSAGETSLLDKAGALRIEAGARSTAGDPDTIVVDKAGFAKTLVEAPAGGDSPTASVTVGG